MSKAKNTGLLVIRLPRDVRHTLEQMGEADGLKVSTFARTILIRVVRDAKANQPAESRN